MSYRHLHEPDRSVASDTFLSRVFGLHLIYEQLHNYQYAPESDYESDENAYIDLLHHSLLRRRAASDIELGMVAPDDADQQDGSNTAAAGTAALRALHTDSLLNSESDSDFSSEALPPSPLLTAYRPTNRAAGPPLSSHWVRPERETTGMLQEAPPSSENLALRFNLPSKGALGAAEQTARSNVEGASPSGQFRPSGVVHVPQPNKKLVSVRHRLIPPREKALYLWANIFNMDDFLQDVYYYYRGKGFTSIFVGRVVDLVILVFILAFSSFLKWGVDYDLFFSHTRAGSAGLLTLRDLVIPGFVHTIPLSFKLLLVGFAAYIALRLAQLYADFRYRLAGLRNFYQQLLGVQSDAELMTIPWATIVDRLVLLKDHHLLTASNNSASAVPRYASDLSSKVRLNAHDIANRIMRKENYWIALVNKDVLDLSAPVPGFLRLQFTVLRVLTRTLEWNIKLCINNFLFNENGQVNASILKEEARNQLAQELSARFKLAALINVVLCPFVVVYFVLLYFFRYFNEFKSNPSSLLSLRQYTPWAEWKLREFNELPHFFAKRLHLSAGPANTYIDQFPGSAWAANGMALVNFVSGAIMAVLVIMGLLLDDEKHSFWSFELVEGRSTLFFIRVFGTVWAVTSSTPNTSSSAKNAPSAAQAASFFYDPEASLRYVAQFTHYLPSSWNGRLHTVEVKNEFCELYSLKIVIIMHELLSLVLTPFILWFRVAGSASAVIDFFREYTIHVDGLGHVCYFAMFNFEQKDKNMMHAVQPRRLRLDRVDRAGWKALQRPSDPGSDSDSDDPDLADYYQDDKMIKSYMYFLESYANENARQKSHAKGRAARASPELVPESLLMSRKSPPVKLRITPFGSEYAELTFNFGERSEETEPETRRKGVLGMINQFSRVPERP